MAFADIFKNIHSNMNYTLCQYVSHLNAKMAAAEITGIPDGDERHPITILEKSLAHLGLTNWGRQGAGMHTLVVRGDKIGDDHPAKVVRLSFMDIEHYMVTADDVKNNPLFLPVEASGNIDARIGGVYEMVPRAAIVGEPEFDYVHDPIENAVLAGLILYAQGQYYWEEVRADNVGVHRGKVVIVDNGAIRDHSPDGFSVRTEMLMALQHTYQNDNLFNDRFKEALKNRQDAMQIFSRFIVLGVTGGINVMDLEDKAAKLGLSTAVSYDKSPAKLFIFDTKQDHSGLEISRMMGLDGLAVDIKGPHPQPQ